MLPLVSYPVAVQLGLPFWNQTVQPPTSAPAAPDSDVEFYFVRHQRARHRQPVLGADLDADLGGDARRALRARAAADLPSRLLDLAAVHGLAVSRVSVRDQRMRWGSCGRNGHICLNWRLTLMPEWVRDYVMIHELMHLRQLDHSNQYWRLVAEAYPDYTLARRWLRLHGPSLR